MAMTTTIRDLMTGHVVTVSPTDDLVNADALMRRGRVRHLPVVAGGRVVGLLTHRDLLRAQIAALEVPVDASGTTVVALPASDYMTRSVLTTTPDADPTVVARQMLTHKIGCVPVVEDGNLVGIVTEADFVRWALETR